MGSKKLFIMATLSLVILLVPVSGCSAIREKVEAMKPEIRGVSLAWGEVMPATTEVIATINVYNPNSFSLPVKKVTCDITMDDIRVGSAETTNLEIEKNAEFPIYISAKIDNAKIIQFWYEHLKRNEKSEALIDIEVTFDLGSIDFTFPFSLKRPIETDLLSNIKITSPFSIEKKFNIPLIGEKTLLDLSVTSLRGEWGTVTPETTELILVATIVNESSYPLPVPKIGYEIDINGISLASGESEANYLFMPNSTNEITAVVTLDNLLMDDWFVSHIRQNEQSTFNVRAYLVSDILKEVAELLGQDQLAVSIWEGSHTFETDILGSMD